MKRPRSVRAIVETWDSGQVDTRINAKLDTAAKKITEL